MVQHWHHSGMENLQGSIALGEIHLQENGVPFSGIEIPPANAALGLKAVWFLFQLS